MPAALWLTYFVVFKVAYDLPWTIHLWLGAIFLAVLGGVGLSLLAFPPQVPQESVGPPRACLAMADPTATISPLAGGTLVLAVATFASVRSANRAARTAERALQAGLRPLLMPSRFQDPPEKIGWMDQHWAKVEGGQGYAEVIGDNIYLAMALRNVGAGIAVLHGWHALPARSTPNTTHVDPEQFRRLTRDLYVAPADTGFWQGAIRDREDAGFDELAGAIKERETIRIDVLYGDHEGGQRTITRFSPIPVDTSPAAGCCSVARHWNLDRPEPR